MKTDDQIYFVFYTAQQGGVDSVGLAGASLCDDNGGVCTDKLRKALGLVKVNSFLAHRRGRFRDNQGKAY